MIGVFKRKIDINKVFSFGYEEQREYLDKFGTPRDEIERSFFQYKCQQYKKNKLTIIAFNIVSFFIFWGLVIFLSFKYILKRIETNYQEVIFPYKDKYGEIIPLKYKEKYEITEIEYQKGLGRAILRKKDLNFIFQIFKKYPVNFFFLSTIVYRLSFYSYIMQSFSPKIIFCSAEYSFSSSILTKFCNLNGLLHYNVMHGEKIFSITDSFFKFNKFLVWDIHYEELFISLKAEPNQFEVCLPPSLILNINEKTEGKFDFTYYLGGEKEDQLVKICFLLNELISDGFTVNIRFHPRYSDKDQIHKIFKNIPIEDAKSISIKESFENTDKIIAFYSTVLYQGLVNGKQVYIDDITCDPGFLSKLKELKYHVFTENVYWLSKEFPNINNEYFILCSQSFICTSFY